MKKRETFYYLFLGLITLTFYSCEKETLENRSDQLSDQVSANSVVQELAYPGQKGTLKEISIFGEKVSVEEINGENIYQGDMILDPSIFLEEAIDGTESIGKSFGRPGFVGNWPENTFVYEIASDLPNKQRVYDAIEYIRTNTHISFKQRESTQSKGYALFRKGDGCSADIGYSSSKISKINLGDGCSTGTVIHEILHSLGFWHEQQRRDAASYVTIKNANIQDGKGSNFRHPRFLFWTLPSEAFSPQLDFNSIMMYGPCFFAKICEQPGPCNCTPEVATITKKDGSLYNIQRDRLSTQDILGINKKYPKIGKVKRILDKMPFIENAKDVVSDFDGDRISEYARIYKDSATSKAVIEMYSVADGKKLNTINTNDEFRADDTWLAGNDGTLIRVRNNNGKNALDYFTGVLSNHQVKLDYSFESPKLDFDTENKWAVGDFDNDGDDDVLLITNEGGIEKIYIYFYYRSIGFFALERKIPSYQNKPFNKNDRWLSGDFNGDGKDDFVKIINRGVADFDVFLNQGNAIADFEVERWAIAQGNIWEDMNWVSADFNGDGADDIAKSFDEAGKLGIDVHLSTKNSFTIERWNDNRGTYNSGNFWTVGDFDGNKKADILQSIKGGQANSRNWRLFYYPSYSK